MYANGNLIQDLNKKITDIQYNCLNLPDRIEFEDGSSISYLYDAAGSKLRVVHCIAGNTTTTDYCGNVIYENGIPKTLLTDAGFVSLSDSRYHYYLQDHQGNNRVVVSQDGTVEEVNQYYPFGGLMASSVGSVQPYKYNGKELDRKGGLDWYDYGARHYDAALGRFMTVDGFSEKYVSLSPYQYGANNPVNNLDINGDSIWYSVQDKVITMHLTAKVFNNSNDNINTNRAANDIASGISKFYSGSFEYNGETYTLQTDIQMEDVNSMEDVRSSEHLFVIDDADGESARGVTSMMGGKVITVAAQDYANDNWFSNRFSSNNIKTAAHEFGHAAGLTHESASGQNNLLKQYSNGTNVTSAQRAIMWRNRNLINKGPNSYSMGRIKVPYPYVHDSTTRDIYKVNQLLNWNKIMRR